jgi:hypothetical protein
MNNDIQDFFVTLLFGLGTFGALKLALIACRSRWKSAFKSSAADWIVVFMAAMAASAPTTWLAGSLNG